MPPGVRAAFTTRLGGVSAAPWDSFNLATHVGDDPAHVAANRARLRALLDLPAEPARVPEDEITREQQPVTHGHARIGDADDSDCDSVQPDRER